MRPWLRCSNGCCGRTAASPGWTGRGRSGFRLDRHAGRAGGPLRGAVAAVSAGDLADGYASRVTGRLGRRTDRRRRRRAVQHDHWRRKEPAGSAGRRVHHIAAKGGAVWRGFEDSKRAGASPGCPGRREAVETVRRLYWFGQTSTLAVTLELRKHLHKESGDPGWMETTEDRATIN